MELPKDGKPNNFNNTIGEFKMVATLGKTELEVGDTTTLTVTVSGRGNVRGISLPEPQLKNSFKIYRDQPETHQTVVGNQIVGKKIFKSSSSPINRSCITGNLMSACLMRGSR